jgi:hypothetical protein
MLTRIDVNSPTNLHLVVETSLENLKKKVANILKQSTS